MWTLPVIVLSLTLVLFLLKLSGVLDDLAAAQRRREKSRADRLAAGPSAKGDQDRLGVFREFVDRQSLPGDEPPSRRK